MIARENWKYTKQLLERHKGKGKVVNIFSGTYGSVAPTQKIFNHLTSLAWAASSSAMTSLSVFTGSSTLVLSWGTTVSVSGILSGVGHSVTTKYNAQGWWLVAALGKASRFTPRIPHDCGTGAGRARPGHRRSYSLSLVSRFGTETTPALRRSELTPASPWTVIFNFYCSVFSVDSSCLDMSGHSDNVQMFDV